MEINNLLDEIIAQTPGVINNVTKKLPTEFPGEVSDSILRGLDNSNKKLGQ